RAGKVSVGVVDEETARHQKVAGKKQPRTAVVKRELSLVVARRRNHIDGSIPKIDLSETVGPIDEVVVLANAFHVECNHLNIGQARELSITGAMVKMPMGMNHKQRELSRSLSRKQIRHRGRQGDRVWICNVPGVDQKGLRRSDQEIHEWRLERDAQA